jgi:hypothetical protein
MTEGSATPALVNRERHNLKTAITCPCLSTNLESAPRKPYPITSKQILSCLYNPPSHSTGCNTHTHLGHSNLCCTVPTTLTHSPWCDYSPASHASLSPQTPSRQLHCPTAVMRSTCSLTMRHALPKSLPPSTHSSVAKAAAVAAEAVQAAHRLAAHLAAQQDARLAVAQARAREHRDRSAVEATMAVEQRCRTELVRVRPRV